MLLKKVLYGEAMLMDQKVHQYGGRQSTKTSGVHFAIKALTFSLIITYV